MDPFTSLRLNSLFSPQGMIPPPDMMGADPNFDTGPAISPALNDSGQSAGTPSPLPVSSFGSGSGGDMNPDVSAMMAKLYQPDTSASDALKQLLTNPPQAPKPGLWRRLLAGGVASIKGAENTRMEPLGVRPDETPTEAGNAVLGIPKYQQAVQEWRNQIAGAQTLANTEKASNAQQRMAAAQTISDILKQQHETEVERHNLANEKTAAARTQIMDFANQNKEWKFVAPKGGNYQFINPLTGEKKDTGVPVGTLSQLDEMTLSQQGKVAVADINAGAKGVPGEITDPNDPTGQRKISVMIHPDGTATPIKYQGQPVEGNKTGPAAPVDNEATAKAQQEIQDGAREALGVVDELMGDDNKLLNRDGIGLGFMGREAAAKHIPGTNAFNNVQAVNRLKGKLTLDLIQHMRAQSKSGSTGFGRITNQELNLLENSVAQLNMGQSPEKFEQQLALIKEKLNKILLPASADKATVTAKPGAGGANKPTAADLIKKYGGGGSSDEEE